MDQHNTVVDQDQNVRRFKMTIKSLQVKALEQSRKTGKQLYSPVAARSSFLSKLKPVCEFSGLHCSIFTKV